MTKNWALVIGINAYNPLNFTPLKYAKRDAEQIRAFFEKAGFEVCLFTDNSPLLPLDNGQRIPTQPTYGNLISFLEDRFAKPFLKDGDNCWFFFAGHGERHRDRDYLMPMDANSRGPEVIAGLTVNYLRERLSRCGADNVVMFLDACRSQGSRNSAGIGQDLQKGLITISSCQPMQKSWEIDELKHGIFTYALLEALDLPGERSCATVERLGNHLNRRVPELCERYGKSPSQIPRISVDPIEKQHFILIPKYARQTDVDLLKLDAYRLKESNPLLAEKICIRLNALAMGQDLEVIDLLTNIRSIARSTPVPVPVSNATADYESTSRDQSIDLKLENDDPFSIGDSSDLSISRELDNAELLDPFEDSGLEDLVVFSEQEESTLYNIVHDGSSTAQSIDLELRHNDPFSIGDSGDLSVSGDLGNAELLDPFEDSSLENLVVFSEQEESILYNIVHSDSSTPIQELSQFSQDNVIKAFPSRKVTSDEPELMSERGIDYSKLRDLLKAGNWRAADNETYEVMIQAVGKQSSDWFTLNEFLHFPCADLLTIDQLWVHYSRGRFGFSVQKKIYVRCGAKPNGQYPGHEILERFSDLVGWRSTGIDGRWLNYSELTFGKLALSGHLPRKWGEYPRGPVGTIVGFSSLVSRLIKCSP